MQTKNVNIPHPKTEAGSSLVSEPSLATSEIQAPPLPPRISALQCTHPQKGQSGPRAPDSSVYSAYKAVPTPRPYHPPPYRMPPIPIPPQAYNKYGSEPFLPGTTTNEMSVQPVPLHMYSSKYPPPPKRESTSKDWEANNSDAVASSSRIPNLAELSTVQRPRNANAAVAPEPSLPPPSVQMWMEEKQSCANKGMKTHQRWRTLFNHSPVNEPKKKEEERRRVLDGEPLLPNSRRAISYPDGISNPGLEDEGYVPSTPNQRTGGSRGQVLLENKPTSTQKLNSSHLPLTPSSSGASTDISRNAPSVADWSTGTLSEDGHRDQLRDAYLRLYPQGNQHSYWPNGVVRSEQDGANEEEVNEINEKRETFGERYYPGCDKVSGKEDFSAKSHANCKNKSESELPVQTRENSESQQAMCSPYNHSPHSDETQYYQHRSGYILPSDAKHGKFPHKTLFNDKMKFQHGVLSESHYDADGSSPSGRISSGSSDYDKNPHSSGKANTASESGRGTMPPSSAKSSSLSGTMDSSVESSDASPSHMSRKDGKEIELHQIFSNQSRSMDSTVSDSMSVTPPLPPLSPTQSPPDSPASSSKLPSKYKLSMSAPTLNKGNAAFPDGSREWSKQIISNKRYPWPPSSRMTEPRYNLSSRSSSKGNLGNSPGRISQSTKGKCRAPIAVLNPGLSHIHEMGDGDLTSTTTGLDMESLLDDVSGSSESLDRGSTPSSDVHELRRQLEGLEQMYSEVLKMLGVKSRTVTGAKQFNDSKSKRKVHGSLSSLTGKGYSSSASKSRNFKDKRYLGHDKRRPTNEGKRFQRLESHVVTLARSVAHLSSEMRTQHVMYQEIENLRREVSQINDQQMALRMNVGGGVGKNIRSGAPEWDNFRCTIPSLTNPTRIKKLAKFFGDEPPLLRLFLKKLGYEKYASNFENERIGMIELPYLNEERLQKIGIPMGPRMRILQEAQMSFRQEQFNIYIV